jgi:restriction endonuclease S subunit/predicted GIY-YIG superfamily endonuclease/predicted nucleotidyltransferase
LEVVRRILAAVLPSDAEVWVFGSRVKGTARRGSDLDLAVDAGRPLTRREATALAEGFEASELPYPVEVVDLHAVSESFRAVIEAERVRLGMVADLDAAGRSSASKGWKVCSLGSLTDWASGGTPPKDDLKNWGGGIPWISAKSMKTGRLSDSERTLTERGLALASRLAQKDDVLLLVRGSELHKRVPIGIALTNVAFNQDVKAIRARSGLVPAYLYYWLTGNEEALLSKVEYTGIGAGCLDTEMLKRLQVQLPPEPEQRAIAHILGTLDDKIELNRRMAATLEEMARAIFRSWFIDFDPVHRNIGRKLAKGPIAAAGTWFVYAIECEGGRYDVRWTDDVGGVFAEHRVGRGAEETKAHPPVRLAYWEEAASQAAAIERAQALNAGPGREWLEAEIARNWSPRNPLPTDAHQPPDPPHEIDALFPDSFEDSELGPIPQGWGVSPLSTLCTLSKRQIMPASRPHATHYHYSLPAFDNGHMPSREFGESILSQKFVVVPSSVLVSKLNPETPRVWYVGDSVGDFAICSTEFLVLLPTRPTGAAYLYCLAMSQAFRAELEGIVTGTSKSHQRAQPNAVMNLNVVKPDAGLLSTFDTIIEPMLLRCLRLQAKSHTLASIRDTLLPKLISGELSIASHLEGVNHGTH